MADERQRLFAAVRAAPVLGVQPVPVSRQRGRPPREALCLIRVAAVQLQPPVNQPVGTPPAAHVPLTALQIEEVGARRPKPRRCAGCC